MAKFIDEIYNDEWEVETVDGWKDFKGIGKTVPYVVWEVETESGKTLKCADKHLLFKDNKEICVDELIVGDEIETKQGRESVVKVTKTDEKHEMYDLIGVDGSTYLTNCFNSHNSTMFQVYLCHYILFNEYKTAALLANKDENAKDLLKRVKLAYENLPKWLQQGVKVWNEREIVLENGTRVITSSTASSGIRSKSVNLLIMDEIAFIHTNVWQEFYTGSYPTIAQSKTSQVILVSTPNGVNHFYRLWTDAEAGTNEYVPIQVKWWQVPGRDEQWKEETIANVGFDVWNQEFESVDINTIVNIYDTINKKYETVTIGELYQRLELENEDS